MTPFYLVAFIAVCLCSVESQSSCNTPNGSEGECKSILQCESLFGLFKNKDKTAEQSNLLKRSFCGFEQGTPKVCCQSPCRTPEGKEGKCVNIENCEHLAEMLKSPEDDSKQYVEKSRCEGPDQLKVCCGPPPDSPSIDCAAIVSAFPPDPKTECCGFDTFAGDRIIGGNDTAIEQYPWLVLIEYIQNNQVFISCGGSLISGKYVLTAAHCVQGRLIHGPARNIRLGEYDTSNPGKDFIEVEPGFKDYTEGTVVIPIEKFIAHPAYSPAFSTASRHDIALIRMVRTAPFTDFIRPICLPSTDFIDKLEVGQKLLAAGWGAISSRQSSSAIKQHVALPYVEFQKCQAVYNVSWRYADIWPGQLCAGGEAGKDSCNGDSGGPLMFHHNGTTEIVGVVSFGLDKCGSDGIPAVYTKVFKYVGWIRRNIMP